MKNPLFAVMGAAAGGVLGYFLFFWIAAQGFYGLAIPGCALGLGAAVVRNNSIFIAVLCGIAATLLGVFTEWRFAPFRADDSLGYFLGHLGDLKPITMIMIVLGGLLGFWFPFRRRQTTMVGSVVQKSA
jgi:hypothetical protein